MKPDTMSNTPAFVTCGGDPEAYAALAVSVVEHLPCGVLSLSADGTIEFFNGRLFDRFPIRHEELSIGMSLEDFIHLVGPHLGWSYDRQERVIASHYRWMKEKDAIILNQYLDDGTVLGVSCQPRSDGGLVLTYLDSSDPNKEAAEIRKYAFNDPLTGIMNRRALEDLFAQVDHDASIAGKALLLIDLDQFKDVNDTHGHAIGDAVLVEIVTRIKSIVQDDDRLFRLGGDEMVIFPLSSGREAARAIADRIVQACSASMTIDGKSISIGASVGVAHALQDEKGADLLGRADLALYTGKHRGRGCVSEYTPGMTHNRRRERLRTQGLP